ncbi:AsmA-like C-terminal region-containing protein, partial [Algiphilus sp.]|uniref:YhdP family protein n=1 Tax=Algiphilus sp. TaxID=1872431 RepID=UPI003C3D5CDE
VDTGGRGELEVRFERLRLRRRPDAADGSGAPEADGDDGRDGGQRLDPRRMPSADVLVGQLVLDDLDLGQLDMRLRGLDDGLRLSNLRITDGALALDATGEWRTVPAGDAGDAGDADGGVRMHLDADLETGAIDPLLTALGYARTLSADRFRAQASLRWSDMDALARLAGAEGTLSVEATEGNIAAVEPGAGRMLGLFNFYALPRRLGLDFRDVTASGLAFDRLAGSFALGGGQARTDDLVLDGPSLRVEVDGRVGLAARDYDQLISIYPDVSGGMTLGGAVLGGPVGVGIALLARELFETPIDAATRIQYRLVGPWDDPQFIPQDIDTPSEERSP